MIVSLRHRRLAPVSLPGIFVQEPSSFNLGQRSQYGSVKDLAIILSLDSPARLTVVSLILTLSCCCPVICYFWPKHRSRLSEFWCGTTVPFLIRADVRTLSFVIIFVHMILSPFLIHLSSRCLNRPTLLFFRFTASSVHSYLCNWVSLLPDVLDNESGPIPFLSLSNAYM